MKPNDGQLSDYPARPHQDLLGIARYSLRKWGSEQRDFYLRNLDRRFAWLAEHPQAGRHRPEIREGYYSFPQGSHLVFYVARNGGVDVIGVLHKQMDVLNYFG